MTYYAVQKKIGDKTITIKTKHQLDEILDNMESDEVYTTAILSEMIGLQISRTRQLLKMLSEIGKIEVVGTNRNRRYKKCNVEILDK
jgi:ribosomal protein S25